MLVLLAIRIAPWPVPCWLVENSPGMAAIMGMFCGPMVVPLTLTVTAAVLAPAASAGHWKLICVGDT